MVRKSVVALLAMMVSLLFASLAMAAEPAGGGASGLGAFFSYAVIAAGFGIGIAAFGTGIGQGMAVLFGIANAKAAFASFADPIVFLFIGSFILAEALADSPLPQMVYWWKSMPLLSRVAGSLLATIDRTDAAATEDTDDQRRLGYRVIGCDGGRSVGQLGAGNGPIAMVEGGFPVISDGDFTAVQTIARQVKGPVIAGLARCVPKDIDAAGETEAMEIACSSAFTLQT